MAEKVDAPNFREAVNTQICAYSSYYTKSGCRHQTSVGSHPL